MKQLHLNIELSNYLVLRDALGYKTSRSKTLLQKFVDYLAKYTTDTQIPAKVTIDWACNSSPIAGIGGQYGRLLLARGFLVHLKTKFPETEIPDVNLLRVPGRT